MAKVKGHPVRPAEIIDKSRKNYLVVFFCTQQSAEVPTSQLTMLEPAMIGPLRSDSTATGYKSFIIALDEAKHRLEGKAGTPETVLQVDAHQAAPIPDPKGPLVDHSATPKT